MFLIFLNREGADISCHALWDTHVSRQVNINQNYHMIHNVSRVKHTMDTMCDFP